jgi:hypothetical protein
MPSIRDPLVGIVQHAPANRAHRREVVQTMPARADSSRNASTCDTASTIRAKMYVHPPPPHRNDRSRGDAADDKAAHIVFLLGFGILPLAPGPQLVGGPQIALQDAVVANGAVRKPNAGSQTFLRRLLRAPGHRAYQPRNRVSGFRPGHDRRKARNRWGTTNDRFRSTGRRFGTTRHQARAGS